MNDKVNIFHLNKNERNRYYSNGQCRLSPMDTVHQITSDRSKMEMNERRFSSEMQTHNAQRTKS